MFALPLLTLAISVTVGLVQAGPLLATAPDVELAPASPTSPVSEIDIAQCLLEVQCCQDTIPVPSILPTGVSLPIPLPTLGPLIGLECSSAFDIIGNKCLTGGTPVCCELVLPGGLLAVGCEPITAALPTLPFPIPIPTTTISIPGLPPITLPFPLPTALPTGLPISIPGLPPVPTTTISIPGLPPITLPLPLPTALPTGLPISIPGLPSVSLPIPISLPFGLAESGAPATAPAPTDPLPISIPTSLPVSLPTSLPISIPTSLPISIPTSLPISLPVGL
ncbi:hypothetical protein C8Q76DRAFT_790803 [Earliella scabrosa]|nr:hypothetical protein C8Q76DRAFT_790803 [Earliella scabrosa]